MPGQADIQTVVYAAVFLIPVVIAILSAGVAWGVTTATIKSLKGSIGEVHKRADELDKKTDKIEMDLTNWKFLRNGTVMSVAGCYEARKTCADMQGSRFDSLMRKFEDYIVKSDARWENLLISITTLQASADATERSRG